MLQALQRLLPPQQGTPTHSKPQTPEQLTPKGTAAGPESRSAADFSQEKDKGTRRSAEGKRGGGSRLRDDEWRDEVEEEERLGAREVLTRSRSKAQGRSTSRSGRDNAGTGTGTGTITGTGSSSGGGSGSSSGRLGLSLSALLSGLTSASGHKVEAEEEGRGASKEEGGSCSGSMKAVQQKAAQLMEQYFPEGWEGADPGSGGLNHALARLKALCSQIGAPPCTSAESLVPGGTAPVGGGDATSQAIVPEAVEPERTEGGLVGGAVVTSTAVGAQQFARRAVERIAEEAEALRGLLSLLLASGDGSPTTYEVVQSNAPTALLTFLYPTLACVGEGRKGRQRECKVKAARARKGGDVIEGGNRRDEVVGAATGSWELERELQRCELVLRLFVFVDCLASCSAAPSPAATEAPAEASASTHLGAPHLLGDAPLSVHSSSSSTPLSPLVLLFRRLHAAMASCELFPIRHIPLPRSSSLSHSFLSLSHSHPRARLWALRGGQGSGEAASDVAVLAAGLKALSHPLKLRLAKGGDPEDGLLRDYSSNVLLIEPLAPLAALEEFLLPRVVVGVGEDGEEDGGEEEEEEEGEEGEQGEEGEEGDGREDGEEEMESEEEEEDEEDGAGLEHAAEEGGEDEQMEEGRDDE